MTTENSAVIKLIAKHTKEFNLLERKYIDICVKHARLLDDMTSLKLKNQALRKKNIILKAKVEELSK